MPKITKRVVDALRPDAGAEVFKWDSEMRGFGVRIMPSGVTSYLIQYRTPEGRTRRMVIGRVGTLTPDEARKVAREKLIAAANGADPSTERRAVRKAMTVSELCDQYVADAKGRIKDSTLAMDKSRIETHVKPLIGKLTVRSLTANDIERLKSDIMAGKTAKPRKDGRGGTVTGGRGVAARTMGMLGTILEYARHPLKLIKENPARGLKKPSEGRQRRFLSMEEIAKLGVILRQADTMGENDSGVTAIRLLLMTGLRRIEALALHRDWIDVRTQCIRFPDTKSGAQLCDRAAQSLARAGWLFLGFPCQARKGPLRRRSKGAEAIVREGRVGGRDGARVAAQLRRGGRGNGILRTYHCWAPWPLSSGSDCTIRTYTRLGVGGSGGPSLRSDYRRFEQPRQ